MLYMLMCFFQDKDHIYSDQSIGLNAAKHMMCMHVLTGAINADPHITI